ncbi:MAG: hypothetical protein COT14_03490 [Candidatus Diapherotrites archaeon CG08_land_8_20_14_0_20_30_16]|nr:MAG: hypothetical protein COT14_03490 [Candidatus Diapherotrites archaeon CG08_land_8_20_14_0_20_30_16]
MNKSTKEPKSFTALGKKNQGTNILIIAIIINTNPITPIVPNFCSLNLFSTNYKQHKALYFLFFLCIMQQVTKASGNIEPFNSDKIYYSILSAGASKSLAIETINIVKKKYYKGISTQEILDVVLKNLKKEKGVAQRYDLKRAIMNLGPSGFPFEEYFARILNNYDYNTKVNNYIKGKRITHEIDIVAKKHNLSYMIECKYHNEAGIQTKLHVAMYTYARFLDVSKFDVPWLATNTKCVNEAEEYAKGINLKITSWNYPKRESLRDLIEKKDLYPITSIKYIDEKIKEKLFSANIVLAKDLLGYTTKELVLQTGLKEKEINTILNEVKEICGIK